MHLPLRREPPDEGLQAPLLRLVPRLKIPRDDDQQCSESDATLKHVPHQRYLRRDELQTVLVDRAASAAPMASRAARDAYRERAAT